MPYLVNWRINTVRFVDGVGYQRVAGEEDILNEADADCYSRNRFVNIIREVADELAIVDHGEAVASD
jgi:hypothetical protein